MSELARLQQDFASGLLGQDDAILAQIQPGRFAPDAVLQIYRNNVILGLTEVLASSYPAVAAMVGEEFFAAAARGFVLAEPLEEGSVWISRARQRSHFPCRTTLVAALLHDGRVSWVHCGDSRFYLVRDGTLATKCQPGYHKVFQ